MIRRARTLNALARCPRVVNAKRSAIRCPPGSRSRGWLNLNPIPPFDSQGVFHADLADVYLDSAEGKDWLPCWISESAALKLQFSLIAK